MSYTGFVDKQTSFVLTTPPIVTTTAIPTSPVGTPTITASGAVDPNYTITYAPGTYTVTTATPTVSVVDNGGTYNGTAFTATATVNGQSSLEGVTPTLDYQRYINGTWTDLGANAPINAGSYDVTANFAGTADYSAASSSTVDFNITPATATILVTPTPRLIYNGDPQVTATGTATGGSGVNLNSDLMINSTHTYAGSYPDTWSFTDPTENYAPAHGTMVDTIGKATATVSVTPISGLVYNGGPQQTASYSATGVNGVLPSSDFTDTTVHTNAGTYNDTWTFSDPNYVSQTGSVTDNIGQAPLTISAGTSTKVYDGTTTVTDGAMPTVIGLQVSDTVTGLSESFVSANVLGTNGSTLEVNSDYAVNDGNGGSNYVITTVNTATGTITPATSSFSDLSASQTITYGGGSTGDITVSGLLSVTGSNPLVTPGTEVGLNQAYVTVAVDGHSVQAPVASNGTFADTIFVGTIPVVGSPYTISYSYAGDATSGGNFNAAATDTSTTLTVTPATAAISVTPILNLVYNGGQQETASCSATGVNGNVLPSSDFSDTTQHTNAGSYPDTWTFSDPTGNYAPEHGSLTDNIAQANPNVITTDFGGVYNGEPYAATVTVNGNTNLEGITQLSRTSSKMLTAIGLSRARQLTLAATWLLLVSPDQRTTTRPVVTLSTSTSHRPMPRLPLPQPPDSSTTVVLR